MKREFTDEHKANISKACKGRKSWIAGKRMPKQSLYKNMASHIRFNVSAEWLSQFGDIEKLKCLNDCITNRSGRFAVTTEWYKDYISSFYGCPQFNLIYETWVKCDKEKYLKPSIDHVTPKAKGGDNRIDNLQFLTWFENRCKNDMTQKEWNLLKTNIGQYFI